eukprot:m.88083 g.88083  ORF g.88083 m.88083 type:complete len:92 (-) comp12853_c0_seq3:332-607(-)
MRGNLQGFVVVDPNGVGGSECVGRAGCQEAFMIVAMGRLPGLQSGACGVEVIVLVSMAHITCRCTEYCTVSFLCLTSGINHSTQVFSPITV